MAPSRPGAALRRLIYKPFGEGCKRSDSSATDPVGASVFTPRAGRGLHADSPHVSVADREERSLKNEAAVSLANQPVPRCSGCYVGLTSDARGALSLPSGLALTLGLSVSLHIGTPSWLCLFPERVDRLLILYAGAWAVRIFGQLLTDAVAIPGFSLATPSFVRCGHRGDHPPSCADRSPGLEGAPHSCPRPATVQLSVTRG